MTEHNPDPQHPAAHDARPAPYYRAPDDLRRALGDKAKREARLRGVTPAHLTDRFYYHRFLARVFRHDPDGWILKGGQAMLIRYDGARHSRDIDLYRPASTADDEAFAALRAAAAHDLRDHLAYTIVGASPVADAKGLRVNVHATLGRKIVARFHIDLVTGCQPLGAPHAAPLEPALELPWPDDWPLVRLYPLHDHIADKVCAMYELHPAPGGFVPSSRCRDLVDLLLIAQQQHVNADQAAGCLRHEELRRRGAGTEIRLPDRYTVPDLDTWPVGYAKAARDVPGLKGCATLEEAFPLADAFLTPLLAGAAQGMWRPDERDWAPNE